MANALRKVFKAAGDATWNAMAKPMREQNKYELERNKKLSGQINKKDAPTPKEISNDGYSYEGGVK